MRYNAPTGMWRNCLIVTFNLLWARGGIGIRVRLRSVWGNPWEFKSPRAHSVQDGIRLPVKLRTQSRGR